MQMKDTLNANLPITSKANNNITHHLLLLIDSIKPANENDTIKQHLDKTNTANTAHNRVHHHCAKTHRALRVREETKKRAMPTASPKNPDKEPQPSGLARKTDKAFLHLRKKFRRNLHLQLKVDTPQTVFQDNKGTHLVMLKVEWRPQDKRLVPEPPNKAGKHTLTQRHTAAKRKSSSLEMNMAVVSC